MRSLSLTFVFALCTVLSASCAKILGIEDTNLLLLPPNLACVGTVEPPMGDGSTTMIQAKIVDIGTRAPIAGVEVRRCVTRLDVVCSGDVYLSDAGGIVNVPVVTPFNGYLKIQDPIQDNAPTRLVTYFWYFSQPIVGPRDEPFPISAMTRQFRAFALYGGDTDTTTRGEIAINSTDCADANAAGIHFELTTPNSFDEETSSFYQADVNILINPPAEVTDGAGLGGFISVKPGSVGIRSRHADTGTVVATDTLLVSPDVLTTVRLLPQ